MNLKATYDTIAEDWLRDHHNDTWWQEGTEKFLNELSSGATILDVGCGAGIKTQFLTKKGFKVTGVDFSPKMIELAKREFQGIDFDVVDMYEIDAYPKKFDGIFAQAVLLHIPKNRIREVLVKLKDKINAGGLLYIAVKGIREDGIEEGIKKENDYGYEYERFFSYFSLQELEDYLKELDMDIIWKTNTTSGRADWLQIIGKKKHL